MEKPENKLSKEQIEHLALYLTIFKKAYYYITHKQLETVEELMNIILSGEMTFEDVYDIYLERRFVEWASSEDEIYWEDNMHKFMCENYFPDEKKLVNEGAWIKIRNETGFEIHYAKRTSRKHRYDEEYEKLAQEIMSIQNKSINRLTTELAGMNFSEESTELSKRDEKRIETLRNKMGEAALRSIINLPVYEVKISRTKSSTEYYLPYQYELVTDIEEFSSAYVANVPGVSIKSVYTSQNSDIVFYLQSRGISKKVAEMMATLKQTYFKVDMVTAMKEYDKMLKERIKFVEA